MAKREPKTVTTISIEIVGRPGGKRGRFELSSGNFRYFRPGAQSETLRLTYQQLASILESEVEYRSIEPDKVKLPKPHRSGDFVLQVSEMDEIGEQQYVFSASSSLRQLDPRRIDLGTYQFSQDMASGKRRDKHPWFAQVSVQAALWILDKYINKFMSKRKMSSYTDKDVVVSKQNLRIVLLTFLKRLST